METSRPSLVDIDSIVKAAEIETSKLTPETPAVGSDLVSVVVEEPTVTPSVSVKQEIPAVVPGDMAAPVSSQKGTVPPVIAGTLDDIKAAMANINLADMLKRVNDNPEEVQKIMAESMSKMTPDMMGQAKKMAMGGQGEKIRRAMAQQGMDPRALRAQLLEQQRMMRASKITEATKKAIQITTSRQAKPRTVPEGDCYATACRLLKSQGVVQLSCSRLATGPLAGKTIKVWYDTEAKGKNRRSTKILGFPVGSSLLIVMEEGDLTESDFIAAENKLI